MQLPEKFCERVRRERGNEEAEALFRALDSESPTAIRRHPLKGSAAPEAEPIPWSEWGGYLAERPSFTLDPAFHGGAYYVQEASSQFVGRLLRDEPLKGARLLDLCAAPGGKSTLYASLLGEQGLVVANEVDRRRVQVLADNVRKWGTGNLVVTTNEAARFETLEEWFDVVAVDAPCSGEGMFRRLPVSREEWSEEGVLRCAHIQREILPSAWRALRQGGLLLYSTCTFNRMEDEGVLEAFLEEWGEECEEVEPIAEASEWGVEMGRVGPFQTYRFLPHKARGEGFFVAVVRKAGEAPRRELRRRKGAKSGGALRSVERSDAAELSRWIHGADERKFYRAGEQLYSCRGDHYGAIEQLSEVLSVVYSGVAMGEIFKGVLRPDWALALAVDLRREAVAVAECDREAALEFLRKGDVRPEWFAEGVNLLTCEGVALGFVKRIGGRVNNLYPNALRILNK